MAQILGLLGLYVLLTGVLIVIVILLYCRIFKKC